MRRRIKRSSLFTMVALVALLSLGIGYASWTETLTQNRTITTANASVIWSSIAAIEVNDNIASSKCEVTDVAGDASVAWHITNAYPGYECKITTVAKNTGGVPMIITQSGFNVNLTAPEPGGYYTVNGQAGFTINFSDCHGPQESPSVGGTTQLDPTDTVQCVMKVKMSADTLENDSTTYALSSTDVFSVYNP
jgi:hypothetical protein